MTDRVPNLLVETAWLNQNLDNPNLRIVDCHYDIEHNGIDVTLTSGEEAWRQSRIPGSVFIDLVTELSDRETDIPLMMPPESQFASVMESKGIGDDVMVVVYDRGESTWSARLWLMLRHFGFDNVAVLNGGWTKWRNDQFPVDQAPVNIPRKSFQPRIQPDWVLGKAAVLESLNTSTKLICALEKEGFDMGHIPGSLNIPAIDLVDPENKTMLPPDQLKEIFEKHGLARSDDIITYCGGGIAGSLCLFGLTYVGYKRVGVYDGSMEEWRRDPNCPTEVTQT